MRTTSPSATPDTASPGQRSPTTRAPSKTSTKPPTSPAWSTATPQDPQSAINDATIAIELDPIHHMGYGHRADAYTLLPTPDWQAALEDMDGSIHLHPQHDSKAYRMRAWIHDNLGNHAEAERDRQLATQ